MQPADLLTPIDLRGMKLENRLLQAPLAGYANMAFRRTLWRVGRPGLLATEMISAMALKQANPRMAFYLARHDEEGPVQYQVWGTDPDALALAAKVCTDAGADTIDLNCGCPVRKVIASGAGSALMRTPELLTECLAAIRGATDLPISAKIRCGPDPRMTNALDVARRAEDAGVDFLTIHGRHGHQAYNVAIYYEVIAQVVDALSIPVIGNGNVRDGESAAEMVTKTGCAGVMVGRGCMGNPWVFPRIRAELRGEFFQPPSDEERISVLIAEFDLMVELMGEDRASRQIRKLAAFHSRGLTGAREFRQGLDHCRTAQAFRDHVRTSFPPQPPIDAHK